MKEDDKKWIDNASYYALLKLWRFMPNGGSPLFQGETGEYFAKVMAEKKETVDHVAISKSIGW